MLAGRMTGASGQYHSIKLGRLSIVPGSSTTPGTRRAALNSGYLSALMPQGTEKSAEYRNDEQIDHLTEARSRLRTLLERVCEALQRTDLSEAQWFHLRSKAREIRDVQTQIEHLLQVRKSSSGALPPADLTPFPYVMERIGRLQAPQLALFPVSLKHI